MIDEVVAFLAVLYFVGGDPFRVAFAFLLFRIFDIAKPPPIRQLDATLKFPFGLFLAPSIWACWLLEATLLAPR